MALSEKIQLLGKGVYTDIPDELTLKALPTASELDYVGAEDFDETMLTKILPKAIEEDIDPKKLLEIDYQWILRCLRILNYGPYTKVGAIFCSACKEESHGEYMVSLENIPCQPLPECFVNSITIPKEEFLDFGKDIEMHLLTIQEVLNSRKDKQFQDAFGNTNRRFARMCYMITAIGGTKLDPVAVRMNLQKDLSPADYRILQELLTEKENYGIRGGGYTVCPKCGNKEAAFIMFIDDSYFRPSVDCLRKWRDDRNRRDAENVSRAENPSIRRNSR